MLRSVGASVAGWIERGRRLPGLKPIFAEGHSFAALESAAPPTKSRGLPPKSRGRGVVVLAKARRGDLGGKTQRGCRDGAQHAAPLRRKARVPRTVKEAPTLSLATLPPLWSWSKDSARRWWCGPLLVSLRFSRRMYRLRATKRGPPFAKSAKGRPPKSFLTKSAPPA
jgi:hypothetical protein